MSEKRRKTYFDNLLMFCSTIFTGNSSKNAQRIGFNLSNQEFPLWFLWCRITSYHERLKQLKCSNASVWPRELNYIDRARSIIHSSATTAGIHFSSHELFFSLTTAPSPWSFEWNGRNLSFSHSHVENTISCVCFQCSPINARPPLGVINYFRLVKLEQFDRVISKVKPADNHS